MRNLKAQIDVFTIFLLFFTFLIIGIVSMVILSSIINGFELANMPSQAIGILNIGMSGLTTIINLSVIVYFFMNIFAIISAFLTPSHPLFTIFSMIMLFISWILIALFSHIAAVIFSISSIYQLMSTYLPYPLFILENLPLISLVLMIIIIIVLNGKQSDF